MSRALSSERLMKAVIGVLIVLLVAALPVDLFLVRAQSDPESITTTLTEWEIRVTGPAFTLEDVALEEYPHGEGERIYVSAVDQSSFAEISFFDDSDSPEATIEVMGRRFKSHFQNYRIIESGKDEGVYFSLSRFEVSGHSPGYFYIEVTQDVSGNIDVAQSFYTYDTDFGEQLSLARNEIRINDNAFLDEPAIDVDAVIEADRVASATPVPTPGPEYYEYEWANSVIEVRPPITLDYHSETDQMESVFASSDIGYAYVGYLKAESESPESALDLIFEGAPTGRNGPDQLYIDAKPERIVALYRIPVDGMSTIMVIEISAAGNGLWQVEALAAPEDEISTEVVLFQQSISIDGTGFLENTSSKEVETILLENQP